MKISLMAFLALSSCGSVHISVSNETQHDVDKDTIIEMAYRILPTADSDLKIRLLPENSDELTGINGEFHHGGVKAEEIRVVYGGCISTSALAHEFIHWRCLHLYGDSDTTHVMIDWALRDVLNTEFADCE